jgi:hypothetical protein
VEDIVIQGPTGSLCVREEGLEKLLMSMKECEAKTVALFKRGTTLDSE